MIQRKEKPGKGNGAVYLTSQILTVLSRLELASVLPSE
jgi:Zn-dependent protease with chaperone function